MVKLGAGEQVLNRLGHHVGRGVAQLVQGVFAVDGADFLLGHWLDPERSPSYEGF